MKTIHFLSMCASTALIAPTPALAQATDGVGAPQTSQPLARVPDADPVAPDAPADTLSSREHPAITYALQVEGSIAVNPANPANGVNFGQEFADRANRPLLNQVLGTIARPVAGGPQVDVGFNLQGLFGTDARYSPTIGLFDRTFTGRYQFILTQANVVVHTPVLTPGGVDFKLGLSPGLMGYEGLDPSTRPFYTLSYVTNYLLAFQTVGAIATVHVSPQLDVIAGIDAGNEVLPGRSDNNGAAAGYLGVSLSHLAGDRLTVLAMTRFGPENSRLVLPNANRAMRWWNDVTATCKIDDRTTVAGEANYLRDDGLNAEAYGATAYVLHTIDPQWSANLRVDALRDPQGAFVVTYGSDTAFADAIRGVPALIYTAPPTTYGAVTAGVSYRPAALNSRRVAVTVRPEIRYDRSLNGTRPYDGGTRRGQWLASADLIVGF